MTSYKDKYLKYKIKYCNSNLDSKLINNNLEGAGMGMFPMGMSPMGMPRTSMYPNRSMLPSTLSPNVIGSSPLGPMPGYSMLPGSGQIISGDNTRHTTHAGRISYELDLIKNAIRSYPMNAMKISQITNKTYNDYFGPRPIFHGELHSLIINPNLKSKTNELVINLNGLHIDCSSSGISMAYGAFYPDVFIGCRPMLSGIVAPNSSIPLSTRFGPRLPTRGPYGSRYPMSSMSPYTRGSYGQRYPVNYSNLNRMYGGNMDYSPEYGNTEMREVLEAFGPLEYDLFDENGNQSNRKGFYLPKNMESIEIPCYQMLRSDNGNEEDMLTNLQVNKLDKNFINRNLPEGMFNSSKSSSILDETKNEYSKTFAEFENSGNIRETKTEDYDKMNIFLSTLKLIGDHYIMDLPKPSELLKKSNMLVYAGIAEDSDRNNPKNIWFSDDGQFYDESSNKYTLSKFNKEKLWYEFKPLNIFGFGGDHDPNDKFREISPNEHVAYNFISTRQNIINNLVNFNSNNQNYEVLITINGSFYILKDNNISNSANEFEKIISDPTNANIIIDNDTKYQMKVIEFHTTILR